MRVETRGELRVEKHKQAKKKIYAGLCVLRGIGIGIGIGHRWAGAHSNDAAGARVRRRWWWWWIYIQDRGRWVRAQRRGEKQCEKEMSETWKEEAMAKEAVMKGS